MLTALLDLFIQLFTQLSLSWYFQFAQIVIRLRMSEKAFQRISAANMAQLNSSNQILLTALFKKTTGSSKPHLLVLSDKHVLYYHDHTKTRIKRILTIDFNCRFQIVKNSQGVGLGLIFQKQAHKKCPFQFIDGDSLVHWEQVLNTKMNRRGFHQDFKPVKKIGRGSYAAVYEATRLTDKTKVAVKSFSKEQIYSLELGKESLINEIKLLRAINHPNLLHLESVYQTDNSIYLVMELIWGCTLHNLIRSHHAFTIKQIRSIMKGLLLGVVELSSKDIIHRDLKPENIIFRSQNINEELAIIDYGLSTFTHQKLIYARCGTPGYIAPEIANLDLTKQVTCKSDIFSLGVILYQLLVGSTPFDGTTMKEILTANRECIIDFNRIQSKNLPEEALSLLKMMLERNPVKRISADQALKHDFFFKNFEWKSKVSTEQPIKLFSFGQQKPMEKLQDSLGNLFLKPRQNTEKKSDSIDIKCEEGQSSSKKSKFNTGQKNRRPTTNQN